MEELNREFFADADFCRTVAYRELSLCLPVSVQPFANVGKISVRCCGKAQIVDDDKPCVGVPCGACEFKVVQKLCVEVPVEFGADVDTSEVHTSCDEVCEDSCRKCFFD